MTRTSHYLRLSSIAMAAIAGLLSVADEVMACEAKRAPTTARTCCAIRLSSDCGGCCDANEASSQPETGNLRKVAVAAQVGIAVTRRSCECRLGDSSDPAQKSESRPAQIRADHDRDSAIACVLEEPPRFSFATLAFRTTSPPKVLLCLRTSRLLL